MSSSASLYKEIFNKVASTTDLSSEVTKIASVYSRVKTAGAIDQSSLLMAAGLGAIPAYLLGESLSAQKEKDKKLKYLAAGAAAGAGIPLLFSLASGLGSNNAADSLGFDADYIRNLQAKSIK
jgi:hypothetical protein